MSVHVHFHGIRHSRELEGQCEKLAHDLESEFPEALKFEINFRSEAEQFEAHVHTTGKEIDLAAGAASTDLRKTTAEVFERIRRQLRKHHDKLVFERRRKHARN